MADDGVTKATSSGHDDTVPAGSPAERSSVPAIPPPPDARYRLGQELGRGGMGRVVEAYDTHLGRTVALKEVLPKAGDVNRRFQREVRITARLEHASIVPLYDSGLLADGRAFYVMRRVTGKPLDEAIALGRTLEGRLALLPNALAAIDAVAHAHRRGVIHRDLKPQNILVGELGETVVIDWGLAKVIGDDDEPMHDSLEPKLPTAADSLQTQVGSVFGTPGFMAPEQARGDELGPAGDVYALGATLYQLIVGKPPFGGTSATEVISSTLRHRLVPVARAAPGTPPELIAIIEKALAFEPKSRYPDAGALAEDVRRFLTGQLVAAHRYTPRQRVVRFARRHRAPLVVAALASVGIAVLAWFSVHRIVRERDAAARSSVEASEQRQRAEDRAAVIRERADQLLLLHARSLVDVSPTHAVAALKQLEGASGVVRAEARAIGSAAILRGVAWGLPTLPDLTTTLEMTRDGKRVLQMSRTGSLQVVDLDLRKQVASYTEPTASHAYWVDGDRKILINASQTPLLFDPVTRAVEPLAVGHVRMLSPTADGSRVAAIVEGDTVGARRLAVIDIAAKQVTFVPGVAPHDSVQFAPDGTWIAVDERVDGKRERLVIVDVTGRVLGQREGTITTMGVSAAGKLALAGWDGVFEAATPAKPTFTRVAGDVNEMKLAHHVFYRGEQLHLISQRALLGWDGTAVVRIREIPSGVMLARELNNDVLALTSGDGQINLLTGNVSHVIPVTVRPTGIVRIAGVASGTRLVSTAKDALLVWDLDKILPRRLPGIPNPAFATESLLVSPGGMMPEWEWLDLTRVERTKAVLAARPGMSRGFELAGDDGRALVILERPDDHNTAVIAYPSGKQLVIEDIAFGLARIVEGDGVVYTSGKGRLFGKLGDGEARELVTLDGDVIGIGRLGKLGYTALSRKGELVRGRFDGSQFARRHMSDLAEGSFVEGEVDGSVLIASGNRLMRWQSAPARGSSGSPSIEDVARFGSKIHALQPTATGTVVMLAGKEMMFLPAEGDRTPRRMPVGEHPLIVEGGSRLFSVNNRAELEVLEMPSLVTWTLPHVHTGSQFFAASPSGRRLYQSIGPEGILWSFPEPASDFEAWLDELTNATEVDRHVHWPWQPAPP